MPYVVVLSAFAGVVCAWGSVLALCAGVPAWRRAVFYGRRMLVGSTVGFLLANVASLVVGGLPVLVGAALGIGPDHPAAQVVLGCALLGFCVGPLVGAPLGFVGGAVAGARSAWRLEHAPSRTGRAPAARAAGA
jgi:hypothetical protein